MTGPEPTSERREWVYATDDGKRTLRIDAPFGFILPPTMSVHWPLLGTVDFYEVHAYGITVREDGRG